MNVNFGGGTLMLIRSGVNRVQSRHIPLNAGI